MNSEFLYALICALKTLIKIMAQFVSELCVVMILIVDLLTLK